MCPSERVVAKASARPTPAAVSNLAPHTPVHRPPRLVRPASVGGWRDQDPDVRSRLGTPLGRGARGRPRAPHVAGMAVVNTLSARNKAWDQAIEGMPGRVRGDPADRSLRDPPNTGATAGWATASARRGRGAQRRGATRSRRSATVYAVAPEGVDDPFERWFSILPRWRMGDVADLLVEGASLRSISRVRGASINTVTKLLVDAGEACVAFHNETVRNVKSERVLVDEIWQFCYAKAKNVETAKAAPSGAGDTWT